MVDRQALQKTVELLRSGDHIFVYGTGPSVSLANLMDIRLGRFGRQVITLTTAGRGDFGTTDAHDQQGSFIYDRLL